MADRPRRARGRPRLHRSPPPEPVPERRSPTLPRQPLVDPKAEMIRELRDQKQRSQQVMARLMDTVREMAVVVARMEKRLTEAETPIAASEPEQIPPPPVRFPPVPVAPPIVGMYDFPTSGMPVGVPLPRKAVSEEDTARPRQFVMGEGSGSQSAGQHDRERWDVDHFLKNGGHLFYGSSDTEVSLGWIDAAKVVLEHIGCPQDLWVRMATRAL